MTDDASLPAAPSILPLVLVLVLLLAEEGFLFGFVFALVTLELLFPLLNCPSK